MSEIKLIVSDLDGTLLLNGSQELDPEIFALIRGLRKQGILFFAASGRQYPNIRRLFEPVQDEIGYICENGCVVFWKDRLLFESQMDPGLGNEILLEVQKRAGEELLRSGRMTSYLQPKEESYLVHIRDTVKNHVTVVEDIFSVEEPFTKIAVYNANGMRGGSHFWKERFGKRASVVVSGECWVDLTPKGTDKGSALEAVCKFLEISPEACMAFGDNENDLGMLRFAGEAWGMEMCHPKVKTLCSKFTPKVESVLRELLKHKSLMSERKGVTEDE